MYRSTRQLLLLAVAFAIISSVTLRDRRASAGKPTPPTPPPPPIRYQVSYFSPPLGFTNFNTSWAMNESGAMVGDCYDTTGNKLWSGFLYDPIMNPFQAYDLNDIVHVPAGFHIRYAYGINDWGALTAVIVRTTASTPDQPGYEAHGIVIDRREPQVDGKWVPHALPDVAPFVSFARDINNNGDVVGVYDQGNFAATGQMGGYLYNTGLHRESGPDLAPYVLPVNVAWNSIRLNTPMPGRPTQVAGRTFEGIVFRYSLETDALAFYPVLGEYGQPLVESINGFGEFCGRQRVRKSKGTQTVWRAYRFDPELQTSPRLLGTEAEHSGLTGTDINSSGDVTAFGNSELYVFHSSAGAFRVDDLVTGTSDELNTWISRSWGMFKLSERIDNGSGTAAFPLMGGASGTLGAVLVPVAP